MRSNSATFSSRPRAQLLQHDPLNPTKTVQWVLLNEIVQRGREVYCSSTISS